MSLIIWDEVIVRYNVVSDYAASSIDQQTFVVYAESELNRRLSSCYDIPFSSNNITAKDLTIDIAFANTQKFKDVEMYSTIMEHINDITDKLCGGLASMIDDAGVAILPTGTSSSGKIYSSTKDYHPIFDMGDVIDQQVDTQQLTDDNDAKD